MTRNLRKLPARFLFMDQLFQLIFIKRKTIDGIHNYEIIYIPRILAHIVDDFGSEGVEDAIIHHKLRRTNAFGLVGYVWTF